ncbi:MAG: hypothetical protein QW594_01390 [Candidatus Woesearchaeota archaeon]
MGRSRTKEQQNKCYVITSAQAFAKPNHLFLDSLENYVETLHAELLLLPMIGKKAKEDYQQEHFHERIQEYGLLYDPKPLNENIGIEQFNVRPYQIDPITGLERFAQREQSLIFASPKQRWKYIPHSNKKMPKALITTGAVTKPNYATTQDTSAERRRLGDIALRDHEYGAIVVEIVNEKKYHWRNILAQQNGKFCDLGVEYDGTSRHPVQPLAMVCGDWHTGYTDKKVREATLQMIEEYQPEILVLNDFFNGHSVSHHMQKQLIYQLIREGADKDNLSLERELYCCGKELEIIAKKLKKGHIYLPQSNHPEFLNRYLDEGRFIKDPINARLAFKLASAYADGKNPVEEGIKLVYGKLPDNVTFLTRWDDLKVKGYQLGNHGDTGPHDGRGSIYTKEKDFGKSITGHVHKSEKLRQTFTVGTMLPFNIFYIKGNPIAWTHSHAFIYPTGVQMVNIIDGKHKP